MSTHSRGRGMSMRATTYFVMGLIGLGLLATGGARALDLHSPEKGSELRKSILDAARPVFESEIGGAIEFVVTTLNVAGDWAFGDVKVQRPGGAPIDWPATKFAGEYAEGVFDPGGNFFLARKSAGGWTLVEYAIGPTDVAWDWWRQQHGIPGELFEK